MTVDRPTEHPVDPLFTNRWSPRAYSGEPIDDATLMRLFEAARWAPSASNLQPWRFLYGKAGTAAWQPIFNSLVPFNQSWAAKASVLIAVVSRVRSTPPGKTEKVDNVWHAFDAGAAWQNLALQASLLGWYAHGMGGFDNAALRQALNVPEDYAIHAVVAVGKLGDKAQLPEALQQREGPSPRQPLSAMVAEGGFSFEA